MWIAVVAAALLCCATPAAAQGDPEAGAFNEFNLAGSNGYAISVLAVSDAGYRHGQIYLVARRKTQTVTYLAPAIVTDTMIDADLGALGKIDVTFRPNGRTGSARPHCKGSSAARYEAGQYVGTIDLHGEEGYTRVSAERAPFSYFPFVNSLCPYKYTSEVFGDGVDGAGLKAVARKGNEWVGLKVNQNHPGARVMITAGTEETRGRIRIDRFVELTYGADSFRFASDLHAAAFTPPPGPFSGSGLYLGNAKRPHRWTGNLVLDLPGRSNLNLSGARFRASLRHSRLVKKTGYPERPTPPNKSK